MCDDSDDDIPQLSSATLAALEEFYEERAAKEKLVQDFNNETTSSKLIFEENWQLSQFWYNEDTVGVLAKEASRLVGEAGRIALISCPSLYHSVKKHAPRAEERLRTSALQCITTCHLCAVLLLEYDRRFAAYGKDFHFYDYNCPLEVPKDWAHSCDVVVADPPFLSDECLTKTALTVRFLAKDKIILCTGAVMADLAGRLLCVSKSNFEPQHENNLANDFVCLTNYGDFPQS